MLNNSTFMHRCLMRVSRHLAVRFIDVNGEPYLERYYIGKVFGTTFYLHRFVSSDSERWLHDHPWNAAALVLTGRYTEERLLLIDSSKGLRTCFCTRQSPGFNLAWFNFLGVSSFHRIISAQVNTWTLFVHGKRIKDWGFLSQIKLAGTNKAMISYSQPLDLNDTLQWHKKAPRAGDTRTSEARV